MDVLLQLNNSFEMFGSVMATGVQRVSFFDFGENMWSAMIFAEACFGLMCHCLSWPGSGSTSEGFEQGFLPCRWVSAIDFLGWHFLRFGKFDGYLSPSQNLTLALLTLAFQIVRD